MGQQVGGGSCVWQRGYEQGRTASQLSPRETHQVKRQGDCQDPGREVRRGVAYLTRCSFLRIFFGGAGVDVPASDGAKRGMKSSSAILMSYARCIRCICILHLRWT